MTDRPRLYPGHQHQWTDVDRATNTVSRDLVVCTVCGFQAPRNAAGLDGLSLAEFAENVRYANEAREQARALGRYDEPEQETRADA